MSETSIKFQRFLKYLKQGLKTAIAADRILKVQRNKIQKENPYNTKAFLMKPTSFGLNSFV